FSEKYGDVVRVVRIPGVSMELCGGTHVRSTGQIGLFRIVSESGVAAGVRRIEAVTGPGAFERMRRDERTLREAAGLLRTREENLLPRLTAVLEEQRELQRSLTRARSSQGADALNETIDAAPVIDGARVVTLGPLEVDSIDELKAQGDRLRERLKSGVGVLAALGAKPTLVAVVTDDLVKRGVNAGNVVREVAALTGGKGGGKPHMAQASIGDPGQVADALAKTAEIVRVMLAGQPA
ncbi:MAG TPA: DHHA1 domain-containing protein, partial [Longimicrobiaceae bacterium]|nr:DHHA1 domain-containing protein [Longimicrobiaceae bacterium]